MDLELEIGQRNFLKELYSAEAGLVDGIGGPLAQDINKVNDFLLGKRFAVVADILAVETSAARVLRLFNNKIVEGMNSFVNNRLRSLPSRKEQAQLVISSYGETNRASFLFKLLDGKSLGKEEYKKLMFQVLKN